jgi:hypothetical protein
MSDPVKVRADLKEILARSEFQTGQGMDTNPLTKYLKLLQEKWDAFWDWFRKLFDFASGFGTLGQAVVYVMIGLLLLGGGLLLAKILRQYFQNQARKDADIHTVFDEDDPEDAISHDAQVWLNEADGLAQASDWRRAYRAVFVATLMHFEQAGILTFQRGRTNGEYWQTIRTKTPKTIADTFRAFVLGFDSRWYGNQPTDQADYRQSLAMYDRIRQELAQDQGSGETKSPHENAQRVSAPTTAST